MLHELKITTRPNRCLPDKSPAQSSTFRSMILMAFLLASLGSLSACQYVGQRCKFCGSSLSAGKVHTPEGYIVCNECNLSAVRDLRTARALVAQVRSEIAKLGVRLPWGNIKIKMGPTGQKEAYARCEALRYANGTVGALWIIFVPGLPKDMFKGTAAHELTHAWAYLNRCPMNQDQALAEGGPTLVEYTYLGLKKTVYGEYRRKTIMTSNDRIYGKGTRRLQAYAKDHGGLGAALTLLKTAERIPDGY